MNGPKTAGKTEEPRANRMSRVRRRSRRRAGDDRARVDIPDPVVKRLYALSHNRCAFPGCDAPITVEVGSGEAPSNLSQIAHIVAASRQGPRGDLESVDRNAIENLVVFCGAHHKLVDDHPRIYTVAVLRQYKQRHEARDQGSRTPTNPTMVDEDVDVTVLPVRELPSTVYSAKPLRATTADIAQHIRSRRDDLTPFVLHDDRLFAFHDLHHRTGPFHSSIDLNTVRQERRWHVAETQAGRSVYVWLLNALITRHLLVRARVGYDRVHHRHFFLPDEEAITRVVETRTKTGRKMNKYVVRQEGSHTTPRDVWWHLAARLHFDEFTDGWWGLTLRPEFHLTTDGHQPLPPHRVGPRVTRRKSHMYNDAYFEAVHFWRSFLTSGRRELTLTAGRQRLKIADTFPSTSARWPTIGGKTFTPKRVVGEEGEVDVLELMASQLSLDFDQEDWGAEFEDEDT